MLSDPFLKWHRVNDPSRSPTAVTIPTSGCTGSIRQFTKLIVAVAGADPFRARTSPSNGAAPANGRPLMNEFVMVTGVVAVMSTWPLTHFRSIVGPFAETYALFTVRSPFTTVRSDVVNPSTFRPVFASVGSVSPSTNTPTNGAGTTADRATAPGATLQPAERPGDTGRPCRAADPGNTVALTGS